MAKEKSNTRGLRIRSGGQTGVDRAALERVPKSQNRYGIPESAEL